MLSSEQIRAARALIRMDQKSLAEASGVSVETIKRLEKMNGPLLAATGTTINAIRSALVAQGIEFFNGTGVKLHKST